MLAEPPRRGTSKQHPADAPFWNAVSVLLPMFKSPMRDSGSRFSAKQLSDAIASIQVVPQSYLILPLLQVWPTPLDGYRAVGPTLLGWAMHWSVEFAR